MNKLTMVGVLLLECLLMVASGAGATTTDLQASRRVAQAASPIAVATPPREDSLRDWWKRSKKALHHLSACALASAGLSYALIAGVVLPGAAAIGLLGAGIMVVMCL